MRKVIIEENQTNPKYYEKMSLLLDELIQERKQQTIDYKEYLLKIKELAQKVVEPNGPDPTYPSEINTKARKALYDNLDNDLGLVMAMEETIVYNKLDGFRDGGIKEKKLRIAINQLIEDPKKVLEIMEIIKAQNEY